MDIFLVILNCFIGFKNLKFKISIIIFLVDWMWFYFYSICDFEKKFYRFFVKISSFNYDSLIVYWWNIYFCICD